MEPLVLRNNFQVAVKDKPLSPEQCRVLVHMDIKLCPFAVKLLCVWNDGTYTNDLRATAEKSKSAKVKGNRKAKK